MKRKGREVGRMKLETRKRKQEEGERREAWGRTGWDRKGKGGKILYTGFVRGRIRHAHSMR